MQLGFSNRRKEKKREERTCSYYPLDPASAEVRAVQQNNESLVVIWKEARGETSQANAGFFEKEGLVC